MRLCDTCVFLQTVITTPLRCFTSISCKADEVDRASLCSPWRSSSPESADDLEIGRYCTGKRCEVQLSEVGEQQQCTIQE